jgi:acyl carrier protein
MFGPVMDEATIRARLKQWIGDHAKASASHLADDTPILEKGILSSLDIVELVLFIESLKGDEVDPDTIEPASFQSIDAMMKGFFGG